MPTLKGTPRSTSKGLNGIAKPVSPVPSPLRTDQNMRKSQDADTKPRQSPLNDSRQSSRQLSRQPSSQGTPKSGLDQTVAGSMTVKQEAGRSAGLARSPSKGPLSTSRALFLHKPDVTDAACETFEVLKACTYVNKYIGTTEAALECECRPNWDSSRQMNHACDDASDCINRAMKIECRQDDCTCGSDCQNQRIARAQYADVSVIQADRKGHGLRVNTAIPAGALVYEYIGEVIGQSQFQRRLEQYDQERIKHFYFMSLNKDEFIDATRKGNLGRFCNHSCNPNCYVEKWVVDDRLRMGIFAQRDVEAGEELTFNYNVDRYGAEPQSCYCGEPNCVGVIGGKTQTNRGPALPTDTIEALGIEDAENWDLAVAKKGRTKRKTGEIDYEYVDSVPSKSLSEDVVAKVLTTLRQNKERWITKKLLDRLQGAEDEQIRSRIVRMHGYQILKSALSTWIEDKEIVLQIFEILRNLPMLTRNKIQKSGIEDITQTLSETPDTEVALQAAQLMETWSKLEVAYRIQKRDPALKLAEETADREMWRRSRDEERAKKRRRSASPPKGPAQVNAPSGPRSSQKPGFRRGRGGPRGGHAFMPSHHASGPPLPPGWEPSIDPISGFPCFYHYRTNTVSFEVPTGQPITSADWRKKQMDTVQEIMRESEMKQRLKQEQAAERAASASTPHTHSGREQGNGTPANGATSVPSLGNGSPSRNVSGRPRSDEDRMCAYENLINPTVLSVLNKYKNDLGSKDEAKKLAKQIAKKIVGSDFKKDRIDIKELDANRKVEIKKALNEFFGKAVAKKRLKKTAQGTEHTSETPKAAATPQASHTPPAAPISQTAHTPPAAAATATEVKMVTDATSAVNRMDADDGHSTAHSSSSERKRKHDGDDTPSTSISPGENGSATKRRRVS